MSEKKLDGLISPHNEFSLQPKSLEEAMEFAKLMAGSDLVPKSYQGKPANVLIAVQMGAEIGLKAMAAIQGIAVINGRPCVWGDAALAVVRAHPECEGVEEMDEADIAKLGYATCTVARRGNNPVTSTFTQADAERARLWKKEGPWQTNPARMLKMRARGFALRDSFPDALRGLSIREEVADIEDMERVARPPLQAPRERIVVETVEVPPESAEKIDKSGNTKPDADDVEFISENLVGKIQTMIDNSKITDIEVWGVLSESGYNSIEAIPKSDFLKMKKKFETLGHAVRTGNPNV